MSDASESTAPKRACRLTLELQADTREALASALYHLASRVERDEISNGVSGGPDSGAIYEFAFSDVPTHDQYFEQVREYLKDRAT